MKHPLSRQTWFATLVAVSMTMQSLAPIAAQAHGYGHDRDDNDHGRNDNFGHWNWWWGHDHDDDDHGHDDNDGHGVVPDSKIKADLKGFRLSGTYTHVGGQPTAVGAFSDADQSSTALKNYTEGSCVPIAVSAKNEHKKMGDMRLTLTYEYQDDFEMGVDDLEAVTVTPSGNPFTGVDNLNDVVLTGESLRETTSFRMDNGSTVVADIRGPYAGDNSGNSKIKSKKQNGTRHYNIELENVPAGRTVYVSTCARLSTDAPVKEDYLDVKLRLEGSVEDKALIKTSTILKLPTLELKAQVNAAGATPSQFTFTVTPAIGGQSVFPIPAGKDKVVIPNVPPEAFYTITETGPAGFEFTSGNGTNCTFTGSTAKATPVAGSSPTDASCTFVNGSTPPPQATLTVTKVVINDNGGVKTVQDFPLFVNGNHVTSSVAATYAPGTYTVTEETTSEYLGTFSGDCDANGNVTLTAGSNKQCTLTNDDQVSYLTVTKVVINDNGGTKGASDFPLFVDGESVVSGMANIVGPGVHQVTEQMDPAYATTFSGDCDTEGNVSMGLGQTKQCIITNNDIAPTLKVVKIVLNDSGRTKTVQDFPLFINGQPVTSEEARTLVPGSYVVTETTDATYTGTFSGDCDANGNVTLALGDNKVCTLTNDDVPPPASAKLTVTKVVVNDDGQTMNVGDFTLLVNTSPVASGAELEYAPGSYVVGEEGHPFYVATFSGDCDANGNVTLASGDVKYCTITNDDIVAGYLTVNKVVINDNGNIRQPSQFPLFVNGDQVTNGEEVILPAGAYQVTEQSHAAYSASFSGDCDANGNIVIIPGEHKTCTITNDDIPGTLTVIVHVINDGEGTLTATDFTIGVQATNGGSFPGNEEGTVLQILGSYGVNMDLRDGYNDPIFEGDCFGFIQPDQALVCTITNDDF